MKIPSKLTLLVMALNLSMPAYSSKVATSPEVADSSGVANSETAQQLSLVEQLPPVQAPSVIAPVRDVTLPFPDIAPAPGTLTLNGIQPKGQIEFRVRGDDVVTQAQLNLEFIPSPSLIPEESHLKVYLNDRLMSVIKIDKDRLGKTNNIQIPIDPNYVSDFNRIRFEFVGHYQNICENPSSSTLWLEIGKGSSLELRLQKLNLKNELSVFPEPFFDSQDYQPLVLPMVFSAAPGRDEQQAAGILASWFGAKSQWRGQSFPTLYNQLPDKHAVVFATNEKRPDFLRDQPLAKGPQVEMISNPNNPYVKILLVQGRDDKDLLTAVKGIAQGNILFRGQGVTIDKVERLQPRKPYDAPNWVRTDRPMQFSELKQYAEQLQASGIEPSPMTLNVNLPPDLFLLNNTNIDMRLKYRYTSPQLPNTSRLSISLNNQFVQDYVLSTDNNQESQRLHLSLLQGLQDEYKDLLIPAFKLGAVNQLQFNFDYTSLLTSSSEQRCETYTIAENNVVIDDSSTIDFSGYRHFIAMPDLRAFIRAGYPFSRLADLSQTLILVQANPQPVQVTTLLNTLGNIGALTGYPALGMRLSEDWSEAKNVDADILMIGDLPEGFHDNSLQDDKKANVLLDATRGWINQPARQTSLPNNTPQVSDTSVDTQTEISAQGSISAIIGLQSPYHDKRSIVALLADSPQDYELLNNTLLDSGKKSQIFGSVSVFRESGVSSLKVGDMYYVGYLPWWERVWNAVANRPMLMAFITVFTVILATIVLWSGLRILSRRRLSSDDRD